MYICVSACVAERWSCCLEWTHLSLYKWNQQPKLQKVLLKLWPRTCNIRRHCAVAEGLNSRHKPLSQSVVEISLSEYELLLLTKPGPCLKTVTAQIALDQTFFIKNVDRRSWQTNQLAKFQRAESLGHRRWLDLWPSEPGLNQWKPQVSNSEDL